MSENPKIPSWQRAAVESPVTTLSDAEQQAEPAEQPEQSASPIADAPTPTESDLDEPETTSLLDQAKCFLDDATIRDAPREKKVAFLESKGVSADDIETLLGSESQEKRSVELEEAGERAWSTVSSNLYFQHHYTPMAARARRKVHMTDLRRRLLSPPKHHNQVHNQSRRRAKSLPSSHTLSSSPKPRSHRL